MQSRMIASATPSPLARHSCATAAWRRRVDNFLACEHQDLSIGLLFVQRRLYTWLWTDGLREETPDLSRLGGAWHTSPSGSCTDQDIATFLKYYASQKERRRWKKDFPNDVLPPRCPLPYDRDRALPRPE
jgi:hypothetical protein